MQEIQRLMAIQLQLNMDNDEEAEKFLEIDDEIDAIRSALNLSQ